MRKSIIMGLGLALSLAGVAAAQQPGSHTPRRDHGEDQRGPGGLWDGRGGPGGPQGLLFKDITLADAQKAQLKELRKAQHETMDANRDAARKQFEEARAARERGDTTAARAIMQRNRQAMEQARAQEIGAIRNILTAEQRVQFDKNVAELKQHEAERAQRVGKRGPRDGHEFRGDKPGRQR